MEQSKQQSKHVVYPLLSLVLVLAACGLAHEEISSVASHGYSTVAVDSKGYLWAWGYNGFGQLGLGDTTDRYIPTRVGADNDWSSVDCSYHTLAIKSDGTLWAWGWNACGQLGLGDTTERHIPTQVGTDNDWAAIACGYSHSLALKRMAPCGRGGRITTARWASETPLGSIGILQHR